MSFRTMPPEAYTHRELADAMRWRETQPEYIKAMTTTPDSLVSFYKRAMRSNNSGFEGKMSESFKSDLKNIAEGLKNFEGENPTANSFDSDSLMKNSSTEAFIAKEPIAEPSPASKPLYTPTREIPFELPKEDFIYPVNRPNHRNENLQPPATPPSNGPMQFQALDERSQEMIREVKHQLNLGRDEDALRMLLSLGYRKAKTLFSD